MNKLDINKFLNYKKIKTLEVNDRHKSEINKILTVFDNKSIKNRINNIVNFIKYDVEGDWLDRINIIINELKNDSSSLESFKVRYGENEALRLFNKKNEKSTINLNFFIKKFGEEDGHKKWEEYKIKSKTPWGIEACIEKFGEEEGPKKWEERLNKKTQTQNERKKIKPYKNGRTLKEYQNRYGLKKGYLLWDKRNKKQSYRFSLDYYKEKFGEEEGPKKWEEYKTSMDKTSLESFTKRYGKIDGNKKYEKHIKSLGYSNTLDFYIEKYGKENGLLRYEETLLKRISSFPGYSKVSQTLFWDLYDEMLETDKKNVYFAELNSEYMYFVHEDWCKVFSVDFKIGNKIIEFDGDYWHGLESQKIIDKKRDDFLIKKGYEIFRVKECDFKKNKKQVISNCKHFIYGK